LFLFLEVLDIVPIVVVVVSPSHGMPPTAINVRSGRGKYYLRLVPEAEKRRSPPLKTQSAAK
jgi:hypothetical protein